MDKTSGLRGRSDLSSDPSTLQKGAKLAISPWLDTNHPCKLADSVISIWGTHRSLTKRSENWNQLEHSVSTELLAKSMLSFPVGKYGQTYKIWVT